VLPIEPGYPQPLLNAVWVATGLPHGFGPAVAVPVAVPSVVQLHELPPPQSIT
jgi:hypothetical protein